MAATKTKVIRFRRLAYAGRNGRNNVPMWHIAAAAYRKGELYSSYVALCGYSIDNPWANPLGVTLSVAVRVGDSNPQCTKCLKRVRETQ